MHSLGGAYRALVALAAIAFVLPGAASAAITTAANDNARTGWYPDQPGLNPASVAGGQVHQAFSAPVQGQVYAQPLVANNTLLVATQDNWIYGLDPATGAQRWARQLGPYFDIANDPNLRCPDIQPHVGITSTPVVDPATNTAYVFAKNSEGDGAWAYNFHGIDLSTGADRFPPTRIEGQSANGTTFEAHNQLQRPALLLMNGTVYAAFGAHCDATPSQGWIAGITTGGQLRGLWTTRTGGNTGGGIWQDGGGIISDRPGQMLFVTGSNNGGGVPGGSNPSQSIDGHNPPSDIGESVVRLNVQGDGTLGAVDFFSPHDNLGLDEDDSDFNSGGPAVLPDSFGNAAYPHLLVAGGKSGEVFLLDRDNLGGFAGSGGTDRAVQVQGSGATWPYGPIVSRFAVWPGDGGYVYSTTGWWGGPPNGEFGNGGPLNVYRAGSAGGRPTLDLVSTTPSTNTPGQIMGYGSSGMSISSNGTASGSAVAWMVWNPASNGDGAELRAYNAVPQNGQMQLLWSTPIGQGSKFNPPAISDNHVYVGTRDGHVIGFVGPDLPKPPPPAAPGKISLTGLRISPRRFAPRTTVTETRHGRKRKRRRGGSTVRFRISAPATVELRVQRRTVGRRVKKRCLKLTRHNKRKHRCTRWVTQRGKIRVKAKAGANKRRFSGKLRGRKLRRARYRLVARPLAANRKPVPGVTRRASFRIVKLKRR